MRLIRFVGKGLHGYRDFDVKFLDRLTFLTGINGSGKTTVLNGIVALISPDLLALQSISYEYIELFFAGDDGNKHSIRADRLESGVKLSVGGTKAALEYSSYSADPSLPSFRQAEAQTEHFRELLASHATHPVIQLIEALPTPMFLGLDRRSRLSPEERRAVIGGRFRSVPSRNVFGGSLVASLLEAEDIAQDAYREARFRANRIGEELQRKVILSLLTFSKEDYEGFVMPTDQEKKDLKRVHDDLDEFPSIFKLPKAEVEKRVRPFVEQLQKALNNIPDNVDIDEVFSRSTSPSYVRDVITWSTNRSQLKRIKIISQTVSEYNNMKSEAMSKFEDYRELINRFLKDSGKTIDSDDRGNVIVKVEGLPGNQPISSLSSGEAQLFVILTNLAFNKSAQKANVFIIDEPELSLHVFWQEMFVDSALSANENIQFVMATHSPSIIMERTDCCIDISQKPRRPKRA
ncbi:AAA family ATPase [Sphingopyxis chilensis]